MDYAKILKDYCHMLDCLGADKNQILGLNERTISSMKTEFSTNGIEFNELYEGEIIVHIGSFSIIILPN